MIKDILLVKIHNTKRCGCSVIRAASKEWVITKKNADRIKIVIAIINKRVAGYYKVNNVSTKYVLPKTGNTSITQPRSSFLLTEINPSLISIDPNYNLSFNSALKIENRSILVINNSGV